MNYGSEKNDSRLHVLLLMGVVHKGRQRQSFSKSKESFDARQCQAQHVLHRNSRTQETSLLFNFQL